MTDIRNKFGSLNFSNKYPSVHITNGSSFLIVGNGIVHAINFLTLNNILFISNFPICLLSTSQIIKNNNFSVTFFALTVFFKTSSLEWGLVRVVNSRGYTI